MILLYVTSSTGFPMVRDITSRYTWQGSSGPLYFAWQGKSGLIEHWKLQRIFCQNKTMKVLLNLHPPFLLSTFLSCFPYHTKMHFKTFSKLKKNVSQNTMDQSVTFTTTKLITNTKSQNFQILYMISKWGWYNILPNITLPNDNLPTQKSSALHALCSHR